MSLFGKDFYPTPESVLDLMLAGENIEDKIILEPSAGSGNIVDYCYNLRAKQVVACEIEEDLRIILKSKCKLIDHDFLNVTSDKISHVDFIIMNPPFSADEEHISHAYSIAPSGCTIIALCNAETIENAFTRKRKVLGQIVKDHGIYVNTGSSFEDAERSTMCEIGLIKLFKPKDNSDSNEWEGFFTEEFEEDQYVGVMPYNFVRDVVNRYVGAVRLFDMQLDLAVKMNELTDSFFSSKMAMSMNVKEAPITRADYKKDLQKSAWQFVFKKMNMDKYMTRSVKDDINKFVETQEKIPFSMPNIYKMLDIIVGTQASRMDKAIIEVFDNLTKYHDDNRMMLEGWKTNGYYLVNRKFIFPYMTDLDYSGGGKMKMKHSYGRNSNIDIIEDLMRVLCVMNGDNYDKIPNLASFVNCAWVNSEGEEVYNYNKPYKQDNLIREYGKWYEWGYFRIKGFKKGTVHFEFLDEKLWNKFNMAVGKLKGYTLYENKK